MRNSNYLVLILYVIFTFLLVANAVWKPAGLDKDYHIYSLRYDNAIYTTEAESGNNSLMFFDSVSKKSYALGFNIQGVFFIFSGLALFAKAYVIYKSNRKALFTLTLYFLFFYFLHEFTQIRIALALGVILLFSFYSMKEDKIEYFVYFLGVGISCVIHPSALIFGLSPLMMKFCERKSITVAILFMCIPSAMLISNSSVLYNVIDFVSNILPFNELDNYSKLMDEGKHSKINVFSLPHFSFIIIAIFYQLRFDDIQAASNGTRFDLFLRSNFIFGIYCFYFLSFYPVLSYRLSEMLMWGLPFLLTQLTFIIKPQISAYFLFLAYGFLLLYTNIFRVGLLNI